MNNLKQYFSEFPQFPELLEAVGITSLQDFAKIDSSKVLPELYQAKRLLNIETEIPVAHVFKFWIERALIDEKASLPEKIPTPEEIPTAKLIDPIPQETQEQSNPHVHKHLADEHGLLKNKSNKAFKQNNCYAPAKYCEHIEHKEKSHFRRKGVKHPAPFKTLLGAICTIFLYLSILIAAAFIADKIIEDIKGIKFIIIGFSPLLLSSILYLCISRSRKCSICRAKLFSFRSYTRNKNAHKIPGFGYVLSTALHIVLFRWFRCPSCGSAQKLDLLMFLQKKRK